MSHSSRAGQDEPYSHSPEFSVNGPISADEMGDLSRQVHPAMRGSAIPDDAVGSDPFYYGTLDAIPVKRGVSVLISAIRCEVDGGTCGVMPESSSVLMPLKGSTLTAQLSGWEDVTLKPFQSILVNIAGSATLTGRVRAGQEFHKVVVQWDPHQISDPRLKDVALAMTQTTCIQPIALPPETWRRARSLLENASDPVVRKLKAESLAVEVIATVLSTQRAEMDAIGPCMSLRDQTALYQARDVILRDPFEPHSLSSLARESGMSVAAFKRKFPSLFGRSPIAYLRDTRLDRACMGLEGEGWSVSYAAQQAGYGHLSNFSTAFRRRFGMPPGAVGKD